MDLYRANNELVEGQKWFCIYAFYSIYIELKLPIAKP